jgi:hypothetical protein
MFAVAIVAVNLWGFERFCQSGQGRVGHIPIAGTANFIFYRVSPVALGILPLLNVSLLCSWLCITSTLQSIRDGRAAITRSSAWGIAYFSLQFLILVGLVSLLMPGRIRDAKKLVRLVTACAARGWWSAFGEPGWSIPWVIFETLIVGIIVSGPLLLLSWLGQVLVARPAAALPRYRFGAMVCLVSLGFASVDLAIGLTLQQFQDEQEVGLNFRVVEKLSGNPIRAAVVCVTDAFFDDSSANRPEALTDAGGHARLSDRFRIRGEQNAFMTLGVFSPWGRWLEISAASYRTVRVPLVHVLGPVADPAYPGVGLVALDRGPTNEDAFPEISGEYSDGSGTGGRRFKITSDGRFAWTERSCWIDHREFGYVKRRGDEIEFVPIPKPSGEIHRAVTQRYRTVEWGNCLYLSIADGGALERFCRDAVFPNRPSHSAETYESYLPRAALATDRD